MWAFTKTLTPILRVNIPSTAWSQLSWQFPPPPSPPPNLEELQEGRLGETGSLDQGHGTGEVIDIFTVHVQHHGLGKLDGREQPNGAGEREKK